MNAALKRLQVSRWFEPVAQSTILNYLNIVSKKQIKKTAKKNTKASASKAGKKSVGVAPAVSKSKASKPSPKNAAKATKQAVKKVSPQKAIAEKAVTKKAVAKKTVVKKAVAKKTAVSKQTATTQSKTGSKKKPTRQKSDSKSSSTAAKKPNRKQTAAAKNTQPHFTTAATPSKEVDEKTKAIVLNARTRLNTPPPFKLRRAKGTPIIFTMDDVQSVIQERKESPEKKVEIGSAQFPTTVSKGKNTAVQKPVVETDFPVANRNHTAASVLDILGFNPADKKNPFNKEDKVPKKFIKYYKALLELRAHVSTELDLHTSETLKRSNKEDSGNLSGYGQHMADAGTDTFERDFALSLVSSEQEALYEIEEAIQRIFNGSYGICEITHQPIDKERLEAVPFTRYSIEGQRELERNNRNNPKRSIGPGGLFGDSGDDSVNFGSDLEDN